MKQEMIFADAFCGHIDHELDIYLVLESTLITLFRSDL